MKTFYWPTYFDKKNRQIDKWINKLLDRYKIILKGKYFDRQIGEYILYRQIDRLVDKKDRHINGWMDGYIHRQIDDRQIDTENI